MTSEKSVLDEGASELSELTEGLRSWAAESAYPLWANCGVDWQRGGFHEGLDEARHPHGAVRRARLPPRQIYAFANGGALGWQADATPIVQHGVRAMREQFRRPDGLFRAAADPQGGVASGVASDAVMLYDQAFVLLGLAAARGLLGPKTDFAACASGLREALNTHLRHGQGGFRTSLEGGEHLASNPHMHLFESALAWRDAGGESAWAALADEIGELALARFIDPQTGALREFFAPDWSPAPGTEGRIVEPGHQFEWAWLLLRWRGQDARIQAAARRLTDLGNAHGVRDGAAINALLDDFSVHDGQARLWPQTERIKANACAYEVFGERQYAAACIEAARMLQAYFATPRRGLWFDVRDVSGAFPPGISPASSFYHIVCAIGELMRLFGGAPR